MNKSSSAQIPKAIKVDKKIKPLHFTKRTTPMLNIGGDYFVSFGANEAIPCILLEVFEEGDMKRVSIESKGGKDVLYSNEIGLTPEEAVKNTVTQ